MPSGAHDAMVFPSPPHTRVISLIPNERVESGRRNIFRKGKLMISGRNDPKNEGHLVPPRRVTYMPDVSAREEGVDTNDGC